MALSRSGCEARTSLNKEANDALFSGRHEPLTREYSRYEGTYFFIFAHSNKKMLIKYSVLRRFQQKYILISLIFLSDDVLLVVSFFLLEQALQACHFTWRVSLFHAGARNCRVYEAHSIQHHQLVVGDHQPSSRRHFAEYSLCECRARLSPAERFASFEARFITPPFSVYRCVNHCAHPNASATFISQSRPFTANKHIACR